MLFLNISTDQIYIQIQDEIISLDRQDIESIIWPTLVKLYKKYNFTKVLLLNWPWGFTNLRVWTLALNLLNSLENWAIDILSITKIDLFKYLINKQKLPNQWIIYIWQKKNVWLYDFKKWDHKTIKKPDINYNDDIFFDLVYEKWYFETQTIDIYIKSEYIIIKYKKQELSININQLKINAEKIIEPKYFIKPIMGKQWQ
jgi:hypothetical protein